MRTSALIFSFGLANMALSQTRVDHAEVPSVAVGQNHDHDHEHEHEHEEESGFDVEAYVLTFEGREAFGEKCFLGVIAQGQNEDGQYFAEVETSFAHGASGPGRLTVRQDEKNPLLLTALKDDEARISIQLSQSTDTIESALKYAVRWAHDGHFDTGLCNELKLVFEAKPDRPSELPPTVEDPTVQHSHNH